jgi:hypothetical protein
MNSAFIVVQIGLLKKSLFLKAGAVRQELERPAIN